MSKSDELDDILNEIKNRQTSSSTDDNQNKKPNSENLFEKPSEKQQEPIAPVTTNSTNTDGLEPAQDVYKDVFSSSVNEHHIEMKEEPQEELYSGEYSEEYPEEVMNSSNKKKIIIAIVAVVVVVALAVGIYFGFFRNKKEEAPKTITTTQSTTKAVAKITNPLTGASDYNAQAVGKRPVACVVENSQQARPQWGINTPDIIVEGEVEGGESRMLWIYADYTSLPEQIGPMRSARPPYIKFSQLFDSIFVHWGMSQSKGDYVGADTVFSQGNIDHINQMTYGGSVKLYGRDSSRSVAVEHTGVLYGDKLAAAIEQLKFRTDVNDQKFTTFSFNEKATTVGSGACNALALTFSSRTNTRDWKYSKEDKLYHSNDYQTDVKRKNLIVLFDQTSYVVKSNYKGSGSSETYCNYSLAGGKGVLASQGTYTDITWSADSGKLVIKDASGKEIKLNSGKTWIGYASSNNGGKVVEA